MKLDNIDYNDNIWRIHVTKYILISLSALTLALVSGLGPVEAKTGEADQHSAHVHGIAELNVAVERTELYMEFISPAANIVGFEHYPRTEEQKAAVQKAMDTFKNWEKLFVLPSRADCTPSDLDVDTNIGGGGLTHPMPATNMDMQRPPRCTTRRSTTAAVKMSMREKVRDTVSSRQYITSYAANRIS